MKIRQIIILVLICLRHGVNPFKKNVYNKQKYKKRFSEREKQWILKNCNQTAKDYFENIFYVK